MYFDVFCEMYGTRDVMESASDFESQFYFDEVCITEKPVKIMYYLKRAILLLAGMFAVISVALVFFLLLIGG